MGAQNFKELRTENSCQQLDDSDGLLMVSGSFILTCLILHVKMIP